MGKEKGNGEKMAKCKRNGSWKSVWSKRGLRK